MKALVTGAAGFVGSTLSCKLVDDGHEVHGVDAFTDYYSPEVKARNVESIRERGGAFDFTRADLLDHDLADLLDGVEVVFHQAGQPGVRKSWGREFEHYSRANVEATQRLLEASLAAGVHRFVYASSSSVYGDAETYPTTEDLAPRPRSPYGVTKLAGEHLAVLYGRNFGLETVALRYFTVYGPRQRPDMAFHRFIAAALRDEPIEIFGDGEQVRDFTYVDDVAAANVAAAHATADPGTVINVSGGSSVTVNEVLGYLEHIVGSPLKVHYGDPVPGDVLRTGGDSTRAREVLNWEPRIDVKTGLQRQFESMVGIAG